MKIIGHRGAAGLALENSLNSIKVAQRIGVDAVEFDVQLTKDHQFVLSHDPTTRRTATVQQKIRTINLEQAQSITLNNGEKIPSLSDAINSTRDTPIFIEAKSAGWASHLAKLLQSSKRNNITVIAMNHRELAHFHKLMPDIPVYAIQKFHESDFLSTLQAARSNKFNGIDLNVWMINPLTYWLAKRYNLDIIVYTVNHTWLARFLAKFFPDIAITTNHPQKLQFLRDRPATSRE